MSFYFCSSIDSVLPDISKVDCPFRLDQIVFLFFQKSQATPSFVEGTNSITEAASWTPFLTATDNTKIEKSPAFSSMVIPKSEQLTTGGGDNSTPFGIAKLQGQSNVQVTAMLQDVPTEVLKQLDQYTRFSFSTQAVSNLTVYMVNRAGRIFHINGSGVPIYNFNVSSIGTEGYSSSTDAEVRFTLANNLLDANGNFIAWDRNLEEAIPEVGFNPLSIVS